MTEPGKHKLSDALPDPAPDQAGKPSPDHATAAEQAREEKEGHDAHNAQSSTRDRMVDIGRGNQQAGRHGENR